MSNPEPALPTDSPTTVPLLPTPAVDEPAAAVDLDPVWRALSDPTRRAILDVLRHGPANTTTVCEAFEHLSRHNVTKHLKVLERAGLVRVTARGRERINHLDVIPIQAIHQRWILPFESFWADKLTRLADEVERTTDSETDP